MSAPEPESPPAGWTAEGLRIAVGANAGAPYPAHSAAGKRGVPIILPRVLGGAIHALRGDGLAIETEREGEYRHARYLLRSPGCLIKQAGNSAGPVKLHREAP